MWVIATAPENVCNKMVLSVPIMYRFQLGGIKMMTDEMKAVASELLSWQVHRVWELEQLCVTLCDVTSSRERVNHY